MTAMHLHGTISLSDLLAANRLHLRSSPARTVAKVAVVICLLVVILVGRQWWLAGVLVYGLAVLFVFIPWGIKRRFRQDKGLSEPLQVEVRDDGVFFQRTNGQNLLPWSHMVKCKRNDRMVLLYTSAFSYQLVPSSFFPDAASFNETVGLIEARLGKAAG